MLTNSLIQDIIALLDYKKGFSVDRYADDHIIFRYVYLSGLGNTSRMKWHFIFTKDTPVEEFIKGLLAFRKMLPNDLLSGHKLKLKVDSKDTSWKLLPYTTSWQKGQFDKAAAHRFIDLGKEVSSCGKGWNEGVDKPYNDIVEFPGEQKEWEKDGPL